MRLRSVARLKINDNFFPFKRIISGKDHIPVSVEIPQPFSHVKMSWNLE